MTIMLAALWIAGFTYKWYWLIGSVLFDMLWLAIKLNFLSVLVRRSVEECIADIAEQIAKGAAENPPPPGA